MGNLKQRKFAQEELQEERGRFWRERSNADFKLELAEAQLGDFQRAVTKRLSVWISEIFKHVELAAVIAYPAFEDLPGFSKRFEAEFEALHICSFQAKAVCEQETEFLKNLVDLDEQEALEEDRSEQAGVV